MRITFNTSTAETLEYLRVVNSIMRCNKETSDEIKAFNELKKLVESMDRRLNKLEDNGRNRVCR